MLPLLACVPKHPPPPVPLRDPAVVLAEAQAEAPAPPVAARFSIDIERADGAISASGTAVIAAPDRFRVELRGPIGPPQVIATCDGTSFRAWVAQKNTVYTGEDAEAALRGWTGGSAGVDDVVALLLGRMPSLGEPDLVDVSDRRPRVRWTRDDGVSVTALLDPTTAHLYSLAGTDAAGQSWLEARYEPGPYPGRLELHLPALNLDVDATFSEWQRVDPPETAFTLPIPEGAAVVTPR